MKPAIQTLTERDAKVIDWCIRVAIESIQRKIVHPGIPFEEVKGVHGKLTMGTEEEA